MQLSSQVSVLGSEFCTTIKHCNLKEKQDLTLLWTCVAGAHLQCVNNHYGKFEYKGMKSVLITDYTQVNNVSTPKGGVDVIV